MSDELSLTTDEIENLAGRLDAWDGLSEREHEVLAGVFALAGAALSSAAPVDEEVTGFAMNTSFTPGTALESFQQGVDPDLRKSGGGSQTGGFFLQFNFKQVAVKTISW